MKILRNILMTACALSMLAFIGVFALKAQVAFRANQESAEKRELEDAIRAAGERYREIGAHVAWADNPLRSMALMRQRGGAPMSREGRVIHFRMPRRSVVAPRDFDSGTAAGVSAVARDNEGGESSDGAAPARP